MLSWAMCTKPWRDRVGSHWVRCHKQTDDGRIVYITCDDLLWRNFLSPQCRNCSRDPDHAHLGSTHSSSSEKQKESIIRAKLKRCMSIEKRWNRNEVSQKYPDEEDNRRPTSRKKFRADALRGPSVSIQTDWNTRSSAIAEWPRDASCQ